VNSRRTVILILAIVVGAVSAFGLSRYVQGLEDDVFDGAALGEVWVVQTEIPKGTPAQAAIGQQLIQKLELPLQVIPATAIKEPGEELNNLVAVINLPPGSVLVSGQFVAPSVVQTGIIDRLEQDEMHTVTFNVDQVAGAAYFIEPGDFINILLRRPLTAPPADGEGEGEGDGPQLEGEEAENSQETELYSYDARYIYQKAEVLAIGNALPLDLGESEEEVPTAATGGLITLAVPPEAVQTIIAIGFENLYLSLVPPSYEPVPIPAIDTDPLLPLPGEDETRLTPYYDTPDQEPDAE